MFLKRKLKIYLVMLSILATSAPINAMKKNLIDKNIISTNEIKDQNFKEEEKMKERNFEITINNIKEEIYEIKQELDNKSIFHFFPRTIEKLKYYKKNLLQLRENAKNKDVNTIDDMLNNINNLIDILFIKSSGIPLENTKAENLKDMSIYDLTYEIDTIISSKLNLLHIKNKINNQENMNKINNILDDIDKVIIETFKSKLNNFDQELKRMDMEDLIDKRKTIFKLRKITTNKEALKIIDIMLNEIDNFINKIFELQINNFEQNFEKIDINIDVLNYEIETILNLKKDTVNEKTIDLINTLLKYIDKSIDKVFKLGRDDLKQNFEKINIENLKDKKKIMFNLKIVATKKETLDIIDDILNYIDELIIKKINNIENI